jgi:6-phosphofructokinase 1
MNTIVRALTRLGIAKGHTMLGAKNGFDGLLADDVVEMHWMYVNGWAKVGF